MVYHMDQCLGRYFFNFYKRFGLRNKYLDFEICRYTKIFGSIT